MNIKLKKGPREDFLNLTLDEPVTIEELLRRYGKDLPYTVLAAKVDNRVMALTETLEQDCLVEFLDMRTQAANLTYQYSLSLIYLKAIQDVLGAVPVEIQNSLNKGLYTEIKTPEAITEAQVQAVEMRMRSLAEQDLPIVKESVSRQEALTFLEAQGYREKIQILKDCPEIDRPVFYRLEEYRNFFYGIMVPSTGYIRHFELRKYRRGVILRFPYPSAPNKIPPYVDEKKLCMAFGESKKWHKLMGVSYPVSYTHLDVYKRQLEGSPTIHTSINVFRNKNGITKRKSLSVSSVIPGIAG